MAHSPPPSMPEREQPHGTLPYGQPPPQAGGHGHAPAAPATGMAPHQPPRYAPADPPGAPVSLPGRAPAGAMPPAPDPGGNRTVFEFTGKYADDGRGRGTFYGDPGAVGAASLAEPHRRHNLGGSGISWVLGGLALAVVAGALWFVSTHKPAGHEEAAAPEAAPAAAPVAPTAPAPAPAPAPDPAAAAAPAPAAPAPAPAEAAPAPAEKAATPSSSGTSKSKPKSSKPKTEKPIAPPAPKSGQSGLKLSPKKPPREEGLGSLPKPPE